MVTSRKMGRNRAVHYLSQHDVCRYIVKMVKLMMMMILDMVTSRRMGKSGALHNLSQHDWPCFPNDAVEYFVANYDVHDDLDDVSDAHHNLSQHDWPCFLNDASWCVAVECFLANYHDGVDDKEEEEDEDWLCYLLSLAHRLAVD